MVQSQCVLSSAVDQQDWKLMTVNARVRRAVRPDDEAPPVGYRILRAVISFVMHILYRYRATGAENVPESGPVILAVNHLHLFDPGCVSTAVRRQIVTLAAAKWKSNRYVTWFLRAAGVVFVNRGEVDRAALRACSRVLARDGVLAIAPEGTRSKSGTMQRAKPGTAYIAMRRDTVIVPVAFWGVERLGDWKKLRRPKCTVVIGKPFRLEALAGKSTTEALQARVDAVMVQIGRMLPEGYRGVYAEQIARVEAGFETLPIVPA